MVSKEEIQKCKDMCQKRGLIVTDRDIAFLFVNREFRDEVLAYTCIYGDAPEENIKAYVESLAVLRQYMNENWTKKKQVIDYETISGDMTFEDNRDALISYLNDIQVLMAERKIDPKDGMKMMTDIRLKLNDKFNIKEQQVEQRIIVQPKFSHICQHTHKECWLQTRSYAMEHWHLIPDPKFQEEEEEND